MTEKLPDYLPFKEEVWKKIKNNWDFYRNQIGLEGDIYMDLLKEEKSHSEIEEVIRLHRIERKVNIQIFKALKKDLNGKSL
jgi:hypothetical protein